MNEKQGLARFALTADDLERMRAELRAQAIAQIQTAARILARSPERLDSATWRLADALLMLEASDDSLPGVHYPTGTCARVIYDDSRQPPTP